MIRVLQTLALALLVLGLGGRAAMAGKPNVVILGLEVTNKGGDIDVASTQLAKDFTVQLRSRASQAGALIPHSDKELIDEKLIRNCGNAEASCLAPIGSELGANYLIYGSLEKAGGNYKISLHLLNVSSKQLTKHWPVDLRDTSASGLSEAARAAYAGLMGGDSGSININIQNDGVDTGTVTFAGKKQQLQQGHLTIKDLGPDRYTFTIDATGFQRFEQTVSVGQGEKKEVVVTLVPLPGSKVIVPPKCSDGSADCGNTVSHSSSRTGYKVVGYAGLILAAAAGGFMLQQYFGPIKTYDNSDIAPFANGGTPSVDSDGKAHFTSSDCSQSQVTGFDDGSDKAIGNRQFKKACDAKSHIVIAGVVGGVGLAVGVTALILAYRGSDEPEKRSAQTSGRRKSPKPLIAVTPIISPDGGGATVRIDF